MKKDYKFDLDDVAIMPTVLSYIGSRSECDVETNFQFSSGKIFSSKEAFEGIKTLPLMAAPMDTVVCEDNLKRYIFEGIIPCIPRGLNITKRKLCLDNSDFYFKSFGLGEIEYQLDSEEKNLNDFYNFPNILIDIANGHMLRLLNAVKRIKKSYPYIKIMVGNVANPLTYKNLAMAGADYVRCSVGTGAGCTTAANVAINYPLGSLISECRQIKEKDNLSTKIVADGGVRDYSDIIKALALGADYVMMGSIFNKSMESAGFNYWKTSLGRIRIKNYDLARKLWKWGFRIQKKYRGMSTKAVQRSWGKTSLVTAEGITKYQDVEYTLHQWVENFKDYLSSNMSYSGSKNLEDFIGKAEVIFITNNARKRFQK